MDATPVYQPRNDLPYIEALARVARHDTVKLIRLELWRLRWANLPGIRFGSIKIADDRTNYRQCVQVILCIMVTYAGYTGVHLSATQLFGSNLFAGRGLHQRWSSQEDSAIALHD